MKQRCKYFFQFILNSIYALLRPTIDERIQIHADLGHYKLDSRYGDILFDTEQALAFKQFGLRDKPIKDAIGKVVLDLLKMACNYRIYGYTNTYDKPHSIAGKSDDWKLFYYERLEAFFLLFKVRASTSIQLTLLRKNKEIHQHHGNIQQFLIDPQNARDLRKEREQKQSESKEDASTIETKDGTAKKIVIFGSGAGYGSEAEYCSYRMGIFKTELDQMRCLAVASKYCSRYILLSIAKPALTLGACVLAYAYIKPVVLGLTALVTMSIANYILKNIEDTIIPLFYSKAIGDYVREHGYVGLIEQRTEALSHSNATTQAAL